MPPTNQVIAFDESELKKNLNLCLQTVFDLQATTTQGRKR